MSLFEANETVNHSAEALIDWSSPEIVINTTHGTDYYNNPFDIMELKAANMDPFDLVSNQIPSREDHNISCNNILTTSWKLEIGQKRRSMSLTDIDSAVTNLKLNEQNHTGSVESMNVNREEIQLNKSCIPVHMDDNDESILEHNMLIKQMALCNEEEKQQIREQTQQRIKMLIEKEEKNYAQKSLFNILQQCTESNLYNFESVFNKESIQRGSNSNSDSFLKTHGSIIDINDNYTLINASLENSNQEQDYFDLNTLKPEWVIDNFSDSDGPVDIQTGKSEPAIEPIKNTNQIDEKLKAFNRIGLIESKSNGCQTILKSMQNKKTQNNGPFLAKVPVHHMVQNYNDDKIKNTSPTSLSSHGQVKPVASSTPTLNIATIIQNPSSMECSITPCLSQQSMIISAESPKTPLNVTKCIKQNAINFCDKDKTTAPPNATRLFSSANKRSNTTIVTFNKTVQKTEVIKSFKSNKSKSECLIGKVPKPLALKTNKLSSLPVPKRSTISFKGKENIKLQ